MSQRKTLILFGIGLLIFGLTIFVGTTKIKAFTTSSTGYVNNGAPERDAYAGATNVLIMDVSLPNPVADSDIGGTAPSAGTAITATKDSDWTTMKFYDAAAGGAFSSSADWIGLDDDLDGVYTAAADTLVDANGGGVNATTTGDTSLTAGTALYKVDAPDHICTDSTTSPTCVWWDGSTSGDCTTTTDAYRLVGSDGCPAVTDTLVTTTTAQWSKETSAAYSTTTAPDLFIESVPWELTYSAAPDTNIAGTAPAAGTAITATEPSDWHLYYYDKTNSDAWDSANDWIGLDNDSSGYYNGDKISSIKVSNLENALDDDISAIRIWQEDGTTAGFQSTQDTLIGSDSSGSKWGQTISTGSAVVYTASSKDRIYVTADIASGAINGRIIKAEIPINGLQFVSTSDGPSDNPIVNLSAQTIVSGTTGATVDNIAPTSSITDPKAGATITPEVNYTIKGSCSDTGGSSVKQVEISLDGGQTWHLVTPLQTSDSGFTWSYLWQSPKEGTYNIKTRATDWVGNTETPGDGISVTVAVPASATTTPATTTPATTTPSAEKPITEMTAQELQTKITEIQAKIIQLLQELINMIKNQISQLQGSV